MSIIRKIKSLISKVVKFWTDTDNSTEIILNAAIVVTTMLAVIDKLASVQSKRAYARDLNRRNKH